MAARRSPSADIGYFVEWVKERSHLTRGVIVGTMMRDEAFHFTRIGTFLERADGTARILTRPSGDLVPGADAGVVPDPMNGACCCAPCRPSRSTGASTAMWSRRSRVAQLLILRDDMPRSLLRCCNEVYQNLKSVANEQSAETERRAGEMHAMLHFGRMEDIVADGLPRFFEDFLSRLRDLGRPHRIGFLGAPGGGLTHANAHPA